MLIPRIFQDENIVAAQSTRLHTVYDPKEDELEKKGFLDALGVREDQIASSKQVHGNKVLMAEKPQRAEGFDAVITNKKNIFAMVATADCTPILIYDKKNKAVAAIHAGWRGTVARIVSETLNAMRQNYGTEGKDCLAFVGTCICGNEFEVGDEVAEQFSESQKRFDTSRNKYLVDLKKANADQLLSFGVLEENIEVSEYCTIKNNDRFYSYRKEKGKTGRMYSIIGMK